MSQRIMGDSSACLMQQPFCYASGFPKEANKRNPNHALGQSISFGRFTSESLAWEKWSTFSQNRYVEEAERFTQPGSVAQKKAFFEAHYKKLAAQKEAALLEQANNASQTQQEHEAVVHNTHNSHMTSPKSKLVLHEENTKVLNSESDAIAHKSNSNMETTTLSQSHKADTDHQVKDPSEEGTNIGQDALPSMGNKKRPVSSFTFLKAVGMSKFNSTPVKSATPNLSKKDDTATPMSNKPALSSADNEKPTAKSPHRSLNFTPIREINRLSVSMMRKFGNTRVGVRFSKASKDSFTLQRTTTMASKNELQMDSPFTPLTEAERSKRTPLVISSPISLSTKERASSSTKKLEEEFKVSETQKVRLHTTFTEKAEIKIRKLSQSFCFKVGSPPDLYNDSLEAPKKGTKKYRLTPIDSSKQGRRHNLSVIESKSSSLRNRPLQGKNCGPLEMPLRSNYHMTNENTSPNIQH